METKTNMQVDNFIIEDWLTDTPTTYDKFTEIDGSVIHFKYKRKLLSEQLSLYIDGETGQANIEYYDFGDNTFLWDEEMERLFADVDSINLVELFTAMYDRRWIGIYG